MYRKMLILLKYNFLGEKHCGSPILHCCYITNLGQTLLIFGLFPSLAGKLFWPVSLQLYTFCKCYTVNAVGSVRCWVWVAAVRWPTRGCSAGQVGCQLLPACSILLLTTYNSETGALPTNSDSLMPIQASCHQSNLRIFDWSNRSHSLNFIIYKREIQLPFLCNFTCYQLVTLL